MSKSANASRAKADAKPKAEKAPEPRRRVRYSVGVRSREIAGVLLIALALLSLLALSNLTRGSLSDWWSNGLYWLFGWGAFALAIMVGAIGVLIIARTQNIVLVTPWRSIIAIEIAFFAFLPVLTALRRDRVFVALCLQLAVLIAFIPEEPLQSRPSCHG